MLALAPAVLKRPAACLDSDSAERVPPLPAKRGRLEIKPSRRPVALDQVDEPSRQLVLPRKLGRQRAGQSAVAYLVSTHRVRAGRVSVSRRRLLGLQVLRKQLH